MQDWIKNLILNFRERYQKLSELEKAKVCNLDNLVPPLQVEAIVIRNERLAIETQLFIFTHFKDEYDLDIVVHEIDSNGAVEKLQEILKEGKWQKRLPDDSSRFIKDESKKIFVTIIEGFLIHALKDCKKDVINSVFFQPRQSQTKIGSKSILTKDSFIWQAVGDVRKIDAKEIADKIIEEAKNSAQSRPQPTPVSPPPRIKGFGTYFYPAIWIGRKPEPNFREKVFDSQIPFFPKKVFDAEYKGNKVVVNKNGFIAIGIEDKNRALRMLNEIMGAALLLDVPFYAIREAEIGGADIDPDRLEIGSRGMHVDASLRTALFEDEWMLKPKFNCSRRETREISQEKLLEIIKNAEILTKDETVAELLVYLLESFTYLQGSEYNQAFIMEWMIIEKFVTFLWTNFMKEKGITGKRKEKLEDYTADQIIEALSLAGKVNFEYGLIMDMKNKRNKFIHEGRSISKENAEKGFQAASSLVLNFCKTLGLLKKA